jgi:peptide deformylase
MTSKWSDPAVGARTVTVFTDALARRVGHEVDHLYWNLYTARMRDGVQPISVQEYKGTGTTWNYSPD